jgi:ribonucleoside-diphosphate reductase alpha chain
MEETVGRPTTVAGATHCIQCGCGKLYVTVNLHDEYSEVFVRLGKSGGCSESWCSAVGRLITFALNGGTPMERIVHALRGMQCPSPQWHSGIQVLSCPDAIAIALTESMSQLQEPSLGGAQNPPSLDHSPEPHSNCEQAVLLEEPHTSGPAE